MYTHVNNYLLYNLTGDIRSSYLGYFKTLLIHFLTMPGMNSFPACTRLGATALACITNPGPSWSRKHHWRH